MEHEPTTPQPGERRRTATRAFRRAARFLVGPLVITGAVFGLVYTAGSQPASINGAQPIDYREECAREGCRREEVKELWRSFNEECNKEGCWMEEVGELAGSAVSQNGSHYYYDRGWAVTRMISAFVYELDHPEARNTRVRPGYTDTFWHRLLNMALAQDASANVTCREEGGGTYDCTLGV